MTRWEVVGAWLHIWTPPRGAEVPAVPWRTLGLWGFAATAVLSIAAAIAVPKIDQAKRAGAAERARQQLAADNAERARLRRDQLLHRVHVPAGTALIPALERAITADARARARVKLLTGPVLSTRCEATSADVSEFPASRVYKCFVVTATGLHGEGRDLLGTGYPFVATVYSKRRELAWCKQNPHADEKGSHGDVRVKLSPVCAGRMRAIL
jgi:hypothetical protein